MDTPSAVLKRFMTEMHEWERNCLRREVEAISGKMTFEDAASVCKAEYTDIFRRHCSEAHAIPRDHFYTDPPDYDPVREIILKETVEEPNFVSIETQQTYSHKKVHLYRLAFEDGQWRIVEKRIVLDTGELLDSSL